MPFFAIFALIHTEFFQLTGKRVSTPTQTFSRILLVAVGVLKCPFEHNALESQHSVVKDIMMTIA